MKSLLRIGVITFLVSLPIAAAWSQVPLKELPAGKWWANRRIIQELRLTPAQQAKIEAVWLRSRTMIAGQKAELEKRQTELAAMLEKGPIEEGAALKAFDEFQQARLDVERSTFLMRLQIKNLLSVEQQPKIEAIAERLRQERIRAGGVLPAGPVASPKKK